MMHYCCIGSIVSGEVIWKYLCHEKAKEVRNAKQGTGERSDIMVLTFVGGLTLFLVEYCTCF